MTNNQAFTPQEREVVAHLVERLLDQRHYAFCVYRDQLETAEENYAQSIDALSRVVSTVLQAPTLKEAKQIAEEFQIIN